MSLLLNPAAVYFAWLLQKHQLVLFLNLLRSKHAIRRWPVAKMRFSEAGRVGIRLSLRTGLAVSLKPGVKVQSEAKFRVQSAIRIRVCP